MRSNFLFLGLFLLFVLFFSVNSVSAVTFDFDEVESYDPGSSRFNEIASDGTYIYAVADEDGLYALDQNLNVLDHVDSSTEADGTDGYFGVCLHGSTIITACRLDGLRAYTFDGNSFSTAGTVDMSGDHWGVDSDGSTIVAACGYSGVRAFTYSGGSFTHQDTEDELDIFVDVAISDGKVLTAMRRNGGDQHGINAYTYSGGSLTFQDSVEGEIDYRYIHTDGTYFYATKDSNPKLDAISFDGTTVTIEDSYAPGWMGYIGRCSSNQYGHISFVYTYNDRLCLYDFNGSSFSEVYTEQYLPHGSYANTWIGDSVYFSEFTEGVKKYNLSITIDPPTSCDILRDSDSLNFSWTSSSDADTTVVVTSDSEYPNSVSDGDVLYNGSGSFYDWSVSNPKCVLFNNYSSFFSYNSTYNTYSDPVDFEVFHNDCPFSSSESPSNQSTDIDLDVGMFTIDIFDSNGNVTNGSIECSNGDDTTWSSEGNGSRSLSFSSNLDFGVNYTVWVNYSDECCSLNESFWFVTEFEPGVNISSWSSLEETSVSLNGIVNYSSGSVSCGFWIGSTCDVNESNCDQNVTCTGSFTTGESFSKSVTGLTSGEYYYVRSWLIDSTWGLFNSTNQSYLLLKPGSPSSLTVTSVVNNEFTVQWSNASMPSGTNQTTVIVYNTNNYLGSVSEGTIAYNGTSESTTITLPEGGTTYFLSAFTYINASGSPFFYHFSDDYSFGSDATQGGNYTVFVRNESDGSLLDLSNGSMIHTFRAENSDGELLHSRNPDNASGMFNFSTVENVRFARFRWNDTCYRTVTIESTERNITFFMSTADRDVYTGNITAVTIFFDDVTNALTSSSNQLGWIYTFNETERFTIHKDELQSDLSIRTDLVVGETYHVGVGCDDFVMDDLRVLTITSSSYEIELIVSGASNDSVTGSGTWFQKFNVSYGWNGDTLFFDFLDTTHSGSNGVDNVTVNLYYLDNESLIESDTRAIPWDFNYTYDEGNETVGYFVIVEVSYFFDDGSDVESWDDEIVVFYPKTTSWLYNPDFNDLMNNTLGLSPVYFVDGDGVEQVVSWAGTIIVFICIIPLLLFGRDFAGLGISMSGGVLIVFNSLIHMITLQNAMLGGFLVIFGILVIMMSKKKG